MTADEARPARKTLLLIALATFFVVFSASSGTAQVKGAVAGNTSPPIADARSKTISGIRATRAEEMIFVIAGLAGEPEFIVNSAGSNAEAARLGRNVVGDPWVEGDVTLGTYDSATQTFAVDRLSLRPGGPPNRYDRLVEIAFARDDALQSLAIPAQSIPDFGGGMRTLSLLVRVNPVSAEILKGTIGKLYIDPTEIYVYVKDRTNGTATVLLHMPPEAFVPSSLSSGLEAVGEVVGTLDHDTLDLLILKKDPARIHAIAERMFYERFFLEKSIEFPPWGRFFESTAALPTRAEYERLLRRFMEWTVSRVQSVPSKFLFQQNGMKNPGKFCGEADALLHPNPSLEAFGFGSTDEQKILFDAVRRDVLSAPRNHLRKKMFMAIDARRIFMPPGCHDPAIPDVRAKLGLEGEKAPYTLLELSNVPLPDGAVYAGLAFSNYDIALDAVEFVDNAPTPSLRLRATVRNATHFFERPNTATLMIDLKPEDFPQQ